MLRWLFAVSILVSIFASTVGFADDLSLKSLPEKEVISFDVDSDRAVTTASSPPLNQFTGILYFEVTVRSYPHPVAVIALRLSAATNINAAVKAWGHNINERVEKPLTSQDVDYIDSFFARYQAGGEIDPAAHTHDINGCMGFRGPAKTQFYPGNPKLDWEFIRRIILPVK